MWMTLICESIHMNIVIHMNNSCAHTHKLEWGSFLSVDRLSLQHLVCRCIVFHTSLLLKTPQENHSLKSRRSSFPLLLNEFATLSFGGIERFQRLFCMNPWKLTRKVDWRKHIIDETHNWWNTWLTKHITSDTLEFSRADFSTLQTKLIDGQKRPWFICLF